MCIWYVQRASRTKNALEEKYMAQKEFYKQLLAPTKSLTDCDPNNVSLSKVKKD